MNEEHEIVASVLMAKNNSAAADDFIRQYMPFIKSETAKFIKRIPVEGQDDELSIAMLAFYESILAYEKKKGSFLKLAAFSIKNRLIDHYRKEKRHSGVLSLEETSGDDENTTMLDKIDSGYNNVEEKALSVAAKEEISTFSGELADFGLSLSDVADCCPKQQRTLDACMKVLQFAKENPAVFEQLLKEKRLPVAWICEGSGVDRKTVERHRKYIVAILLAFTNGFEIIRGHLGQMKKREVQKA